MFFLQSWKVKYPLANRVRVLRTTFDKVADERSLTAGKFRQSRSELHAGEGQAHNWGACWQPSAARDRKQGIFIVLQGNLTKKCDQASPERQETTRSESRSHQNPKACDRGRPSCQISLPGLATTAGGQEEKNIDASLWSPQQLATADKQDFDNSYMFPDWEYKLQAGIYFLKVAVAS